MDLENTDTPKYVGVTLDRTLSYKTHIHNTEMKVATRDNLLKKLANSRCGTNARTIRTTALALCYSTAEYAAPVWERSTYAHLQNPELNQACRAITGGLKPTNVENLYLPAGIAPPEIRRSVCARVKRTKQEEREREAHSLFGHTPARRRIKSRKVDKLVTKNKGRSGDISTETQHVNLALATENTSHMLQYTLLAHPCTLDDLLEFNDTAQAFTERWKKIV